MKKIIYLLASLLLFTRCSSFLEVEPKSSVGGEQIIADETSAKAALNGVYSSLRNYYSVNFQSIAYLSGDNIEWTGSQSQVQEFINHRVSPENATISATWVGIYNAINGANGVISSLVNYSSDNISASVKNQVLGQAYALRALAYFDLVRIWGGVPLILSATNKVGDNIGVERSSAAAVYAQIGKDLDLAEDLLTTQADRYTVHKNTVYALKARYHIYQKNWTQAKEYATKIIQDTNYGLLDSYASFFVGNVTGTRESVFELFYSANEPNSHRGQWQPQTNGGTRQWAPNAALIALLTNAETGGDRQALIAKDNQGRWYGNLYYRSPASDPTYILRLAELYLIRAEASAQLGNNAEALADLNAIRRRAKLADRVSSTSAATLLFIEQERRLEFALEAHRWFDLVRTGRAKEVLGISEDFRLLLPLPFSQVQADPILTQNPGY